MRRHLALLALLGAGSLSPAAAHAELRLSASLLPPSAEVGDLVTATLELRGTAAELATAPRFPAWDKTWGEAEVRAAPAPVRREENGAVVYRQRLTLAAFRTGKIVLPPVAVEVPAAGAAERLSTPADLALEIRSVLPAAAATPQPKPGAPPHPLPWGERFFWALGIGAALLAAGIVVARRARRAAAGSEPRAVPAPPPLVELEQALARLRAAAPRLAPVAAHTELSLAVRRFLARRAGVPALESTNAEIDRALRQGDLPREPGRAVVRLLRECDLVKFARVDAAPAAVETRLGVAGELGRTIEAHFAPPPVAEEPA